MKVLIVGVDTLANYKNKKTQALDPSVMLHMITKSDCGFKATKRPAFISTSSEIWSSLLEVAGSPEKIVGYYACVDFNESGFIDDITLLEPSGMTIPWKK